MILCKATTTESQRELINAMNIYGVESNLAFNESLLLRSDDEIDFGALQHAANRLAKRHDSLRMTFSGDGTTLFVHDALPPALEFVDLSQHKDPAAQFDAIRQAAVTQAFDIEQGPLLKFILVREANQASSIIIVVHHLVCDGWSFAVLLEDLALLYSKQVSDAAVFLEKEDYFIDYMHALASEEYREKEQQDLDYWTRTYHTLPNPLELPTDYPRTSERRLAASYQEYTLDAEFVKRLRDTAKKHKCSLVVLLMMGFASLMNRLTGNDSVVVALPSAGQAMTGLNRVIGHCVNTLPILINIEDEIPLQQLLTAFRDSFFEQSEHQHITQGGLLQRLPLQRDLNAAPLASVMFNLDQDMYSFRFGNTEMTVGANPRRYEYFDLFLNVADNTRELTLQCQFNQGRFSGESVLTWMQTYHKLLEEICIDADRPLSALPLTPARPEWLAAYREKASGPPQAIPELVSHLSQQMAQAADKTAIECDDTSLSYRQLDQQANQIAHVLIDSGVKPGDLVGICLDRTPDLIPSLLGVWKAGAGYVPLDPTFPDERLHYMVDTAKPAMILTQESYQALYPAQSLLLLDKDRDRVSAQANTSCDVDVDGGSPAYVIFTSGSTGQPKGVQVPRRAVANFLNAMATQPGMSAADKLLAVTTLSFDISVLELFLPLWVGASVVLATRDDVVDGNRLLSLIKKHKVNTMQATPATWKLLLQAGWRGNNAFTLLCGGEAFPADLVAQLVPICKQVWNMYGPTETTVWSTCHLISKPDSPVLIGRPIGNTQCYICNDRQQLLPDGMPGELLIGGEGVATGYLGRDDLSRERFIDNPYGNGKLYRTGDKARWTRDGLLEYFGRMDNQVKLRGYRIELGEIEVILRKHPQVQDCALGIVSVTEGDQRLVAYVVAQGQPPQLAEIKQHLAAYLPAYMLPNHLLILDALPQTLNGKLDRKALAQLQLHPTTASEPAVAAPVAASTPAESLNEVQAQLLPIWQFALQTTSANLDDNFFDLGGHSILIAQMIARIEEALAVRLSYREIYGAPTLRKLADLVQAKLANRDQAGQRDHISKRPKLDERELSFAQQRLWFMEKLNGPTSAYNLPTAFRFMGKFNLDAFNAAFSEFLSRQESMRYALVAEDDVHAKPVVSEDYPSVPLLDWSQEAADKHEQMFVDYYSKRQKHIFSLQDYPLYIAELIKFSDALHILFIMPHHVIFDGGSFDIFVHEFTTLYKKHAGFEYEPLPELAIQYADFAAWNMEFIKSDSAKQQIDFWVEQLSGELQVLEFPADYARPENDISDGETVEFVFRPGTVDRLSAFCKQHDVSFFMLLLATYGLMLHKYTEQTDLVVGAPVADRNKDVEEVIGLFVNPLPLRLRIEPHESFMDYLLRVKDVALQALDNSEVPFEKLVEILNPPRDLSRSPIFQTSITYQDVSRREQQMGDIEVEQINLPFRESALDFNMWLKRRGDFLEGGIIYTTALYKQSSMERVAQYYCGLLDQVLADHRKPVTAYSGYSADENAALLSRLVGPEQDWRASPNMAALLQPPLREHADKIAVVCGDDSLSYAALDSKSNQLANYLIAQGVGAGELVGISMDRSVDMLVVLLGILKAGAAYLPLDPDFPVNRLQFMLQDSGARYLIGNEKYFKLYPEIKQRIAVEALVEEIAASGSEPPAVNIAADSPAYIIYTSGSTGLPKGVVVPHGAVVNFLTSMAQQPGMQPDDVLLAVTTLSFDIAVLELYLPLLAGGKVVLAKKDEVADGPALIRLLEQHAVSVMQATPSTWRLLLASGWRGAPQLKALCGGEALAPDLARELLPKLGELWNMYGPTETTVWSTCMQIADAEQIYLGQPIANTRCYLLDADNQPVPEGAAGELCIGGDGVTLGYHQREPLTSERFVDNPFAAGKLYKTGDKVRLNSDGQLEYLGRLDQQIKLRGYRIEIGEIEARLLDYAEIENGAVVIHGNTAAQKLVAFYTLTPGAKNSIMQIRKHMAQSLPKYMIPEQFIALDSLPLTPNGKVDRKTLASQTLEKQAHEVGVGQRPSTPSEKYHADLWCQFLKLDTVGLSDNFFDVGGHSLLSLEVANRARQEKGVVIPPRVFVMSTLGQIANAYPVADEAAVAQVETTQSAETVMTAEQAAGEKSTVTNLFGRLFNKKQESK